MGHVSGNFGLTGGVASGKTTVARMFEALGARIIDADQLGHELLRAASRAYQEVLAQFGREILDASGEINRGRLAALVFAEPSRLAALNAILHPKILNRVEEIAAEYRAVEPAAVILVEAALIYEAEVEDRLAKVIVAWCRPEQQIARLVAKTGMSRAEAERRIAVQMPVEEKRRRADCVIDCSGSVEDSRARVQTVYSDLKELF